jgi:hypothetical protein
MVKNDVHQDKIDLSNKKYAVYYSKEYAPRADLDRRFINFNHYYYYYYTALLAVKFGIYVVIIKI